jgi:hypothetical protein
LRLVAHGLTEEPSSSSAAFVALRDGNSAPISNTGTGPPMVIVTITPKRQLTNGRSGHHEYSPRGARAHLLSATNGKRAPIAFGRCASRTGGPGRGGSPSGNFNSGIARSASRTDNDRSARSAKAGELRQKSAPRGSGGRSSKSQAGGVIPYREATAVFDLG